MSRRLRCARAARVILLCGAAACSGDSTGPSFSAQCGRLSLLSLAPLQAVTVDCSTGGHSVTLVGNGATYLVVPQLAIGDAGNRPVSYALTAGTGAVSAAVASGAVAVAATQGSAGAAARPGPGLRQRAFDAALRRKARAAATSPAAPRSEASFAVGPPPPAGSLRDFHVLATVDTGRQTFQRVTARLGYVGTNVLVYQDTLAPAGGFSPSELGSFGQLFDQTFYPLDLDAFGNPSDIDQNGRVIVLLSPVVNQLTSDLDCASQGYIAGFFTGFDLTSSDTSANHGEVFYSVVPDPHGTLSCPHSVDVLLGDVPSVFLHELQHLINYSQHVLVHGGSAEDGWLDEGLSLVAQELGSLYYEQKFPPPSGRSNPNQLLPDSAEGFILTEFASSYTYLLQPDTVALTEHSDGELGLVWRGGDWLLLRWLGDQFGAAFYQRLEQSGVIGTANIAAAAGEPFAGLFGDFSLALYTDSLPGLSKSQIPARDRFATRSLRRAYQAYFDAAGPSPSVPRPFPLTPAPLTGTVTGSLVPGTPVFYQLTTAGGAPSVQLDFTSPGGAALPSRLHPQVSVFRLP
ncbi:MAG: hypothetical protein ACREOQ_19045 [Gemmatimonadales bacterium]